MEINKNIRYAKNELLRYFRSRATKFLSKIQLKYGSTQYKKQASAINKSLVTSKESLIQNVIQKAGKETWTNQE